jgi:hypothetical protein
MERHLQNRRGNPAGSVACTVFLLVVAGGCQQYARITWDPPKHLEAEAKTPLRVGNLAELKLKGEAWDEGRPAGTIGRHTWTVFALPGPFIHTHSDTPVQESFGKAVRQALEAAGYELVDAGSASSAGPVLRGEVNQCWWWSYTWLWPLCLQGGQNRVTLVLEDRDGNVLWQRQFSRYEPGVAAGGAYAFDLMIKWSVTKLLQDIVEACSADEFKAALRGEVPVQG